MDDTLVLDRYLRYIVSDLYVSDNIYMTCIKVVAILVFIYVKNAYL